MGYFKFHLEKRSFFLFMIVLFLFVTVEAQTKRIVIKFGDVKAQDFAPTAYAVDSSADAVYLFDGGSSTFEGNNNGYFNVVYTRHTRIRLLKKTSFDDIATIEIPLAVETNYEQRLMHFEAATYNIEDGKVTVIKADKGSLLKENEIKTREGSEVLYKFTFSGIKEGSIIEYSYSVNYPGYYYVHPWYFQKKYPVLWSEYEFTEPEFYRYLALQKGIIPYTIDTAKLTHENYTVTDVSTEAFEKMQVFTVPSNTVNTLWAIKDIPAIKKEPFISSMDNYTSKIEFKLFSVNYPNQAPIPKTQDWLKEASNLMESEEFGADLSNSNNWMNDDLKKVINGAADSLEQVKKIYAYVRDNFSCTNYDAWSLSQPIKKVYQARKGNVAEINLLLTAMLRNRGFNAVPVILSTRDNGQVTELYPIMNQYNYVISRVNVNGHFYLLDAADNKLGFNRLSENCYNKSGRVIDFLPELIDLSADSVKETKLTSVFVINGDKGMDASFSSNLGYFESLGIRDELAKTKEEDFFNKIKKGYSFDVSISDTTIDSLKLLDYPVALKYSMHFDLSSDDDIIYFNPMLGEAYKENLFKSAERYYPVEMNGCSDEVYILNMETPKGYTIDELPKSVRVNLNETDGMFEYIIGKTDDGFQLRCRIQLKKANFEPDDYQTLRDFFTYIVKKQAEEVVFKKMK